MRSTDRRRVNTDLIGGLVGVALAAVFWFNREPWSFWSAVFPNVVLGLIGVLSVLLIVKSVVRPEARALFTEGSRTRMVVTGVVLLAWSFAFGRLGAALSSFLAFSFLVLYLSTAERRLRLGRSLLWMVFVAVEIAALYIIFTRVLNVPLPRGVAF